MRAIRKDSLFPQVAGRLRQRIETGALTGARKPALEFKVNVIDGKQTFRAAERSFAIGS